MSQCPIENCFVCAQDTPPVSLNTTTSWTFILKFVLCALQYHYPHVEYFSNRLITQFVKTHWNKIGGNKKWTSDWKSRISDCLSHNSKCFESIERGKWRLRQDPSDELRLNTQNLPFLLESLYASRGITDPTQNSSSNSTPSPTPPSSPLIYFSPLSSHPQPSHLHHAIPYPYSQHIVPQHASTKPHLPKSKSLLTLTRNHSLTDPLPFRSPSPLQHTTHSIHLKRSYSSPEEPRDITNQPTGSPLSSGTATPTVSITNSVSDLIEGYPILSIQNSSAALGDDTIEDDDPIQAEQTSAEYPMKRHRSWDMINGSPLTTPPKPPHLERERERAPHERKLSKSKSTLTVTRNHSLTDPLPFPLSTQTQKTPLPFPPFPAPRPTSYQLQQQQHQQQHHPLDLTPLTNALPLYLMQLNNNSTSDSNSISTPESKMSKLNNNNNNGFTSSQPTQETTSLDGDGEALNQVVLPPFQFLDIETKRHYHPPPPLISNVHSSSIPLTPPPTPTDQLDAPTQSSPPAPSFWAKYKYHQDQCMMNAITRASFSGSGSRMRIRENSPPKENEAQNV